MGRKKSEYAKKVFPVRLTKEAQEIVDNQDDKPAFVNKAIINQALTDRVSEAHKLSEK